MPLTTPFDEHAPRYLAWFEKHRTAYLSELAAVRALWPPGAHGIEIGVGAGHFAAPLGIGTGVEPSPAMRTHAVARGLHVMDGVAENLPVADASYDAVLMVTTICFVDDPEQACREAFRVLREGGCLVVGFVDRDSRLGQAYEQERAESLFYGQATFYGVGDVEDFMRKAGFGTLEYRQTLFGDPARMPEPDPVREGYGTGAFVVLRGWKGRLATC